MKRESCFFMLFLLLAGAGFTQTMTVKDSDANILMEVNDEGTVGSITLPAGSAPSTNTHKLYNASGSLFWNGSALGTAGNAGGWTDGGGSVFTATATDKVGIGTATPEFKLSLDGGGGVIAKGTFGTDTTLTTLGAGTRLIWYPKKAAFRAGLVDGDQWNDANIGNYSTALGKANTASGVASMAIGEGNVASAMHSTIMGYHNNATGDGSTVMGAHNTVSSYLSVVAGQWNVGGGSNSWQPADPLVEIGIGDDADHKANAVTVLKNGKVGVGTAMPNTTLHIQNSGSTDWNEMLDILAPEATNGLHTSGIIFGRRCARNESGNMYFIPSATDQKGRISFSIWDFSDLVTIEGTGNVGIGDPTPDYLLDMEADGAGGYYSAADHQWHNGSSRKLKQDIEPNRLDVLGILNDVKVVQYRYKSEAAENPNASLHLGFIAEDTPELLTGKDRNSMSTGDCIGLLLAVVKEQQKAIESLQAKVEGLGSE